MQAIVQDEYGTTDVLHSEEIERPTIADNEVLVRVHAAGVDRGVWHLMTGQPYLIRLMGFGLRRPKNRVRGMDLAGTVEAVGADVTRFTPGDEVLGIGNATFAEFSSAREDKLVLKPVNLSFEQAGALATSALTALQGLRDAGGLESGQHVLVIGAGGGVGSFAVQIAKALGAEVTGVCSTSKTELVRSLGADQVIDYTQEDFAARPERYDVILDIAGNRSLSHLRRALTSRGTLVITGGEGGGRWFGGIDRQIRALAISPFIRHKLTAFIASENVEDLQVLSSLVESGQLTPVVDRTFPLAETPEAIRYLEAGHVRGKVVVTV